MLFAFEAMNYMVNLLREHVSTDASIHYVITNGGRAPNVVPDFAEVFYYVRHYEIAGLEDVWERVVKAAEGAAKGTGPSRRRFERGFELPTRVYLVLQFN